MRRIAIATGIVLGLLSARADAFCGFYVSGGDGEMFNNATQVVLMRVGTRTVLAMQNNYQGPPTDFAMVVPVPVVLHEGDVKTLPRGVLKKIDTLGSPRLVEYWEQDPCMERRERDYGVNVAMAPSPRMAQEDAQKPGDYGVKIEAQFAVGEYDVVILSATESTGLDRYLRDQKYKIPQGAEPLLRPYVEGGSKFFVAKVNPKKVQFVDGQAQLSPLRFHYDSEEFSLPIRLGLANAKDKQDLIVSILAMDRYQVANYQNATIPTNIDVKDEVRARFGEFYAALFDRTVEKHPGAVITEYAWQATSCDPCPGPTLDASDLATLGGDVVEQERNGQPRYGYYYGGGFTLTRLHARYGKGDVPNDLVFKKAEPIVGGREIRRDGKLEESARPDSYNNFQGRYAIRHPWTGPILCAQPRRGIWGGPPSGTDMPTNQVATDTAFAPRGNIELPKVIAQDVPEIDLKTTAHGCGCSATSTGGFAGGALLAGAVIFGLRRRR